MNLTLIPINGTWSLAQKAIQDNFTALKTQYSPLPLVVTINTNRIKDTNENDYSIRLVDVSNIDTKRDYPIGIFLNEGDHYIIMSLTNLSNKTAEFVGNNGTNATQIMHNVITAFDGLTKTQVLVTTGDSVRNCLTYSVNKSVSISVDTSITSFKTSNLIQLKNDGVTPVDSGKWWIPSVGELFLIFKNYDAINAVLTELKNKEFSAGPVTCDLLEMNQIYWTSVPTSTTSMWRIFKQSRGLIIGGAKNNSPGFIRPVTNFNLNS